MKTLLCFIFGHEIKSFEILREFLRAKDIEGTIFLCSRCGGYHVKEKFALWKEILKYEHPKPGKRE